MLFLTRIESPFLIVGSPSHEFIIIAFYDKGAELVAVEGLNCISHIFSNCSRHARSVCRTSLSVVELIVMYKAVSSAKSLAVDLTSSVGSRAMRDARGD